MEQIESKLCEGPTSQPQLHYDDCLRHVVYHQVAALTSDKTSFLKRVRNLSDTFLSTLRNVFFLREKVKSGQVNLLQREYLFAIKHESYVNVKAALQKWKKFSNTYARFMKKMPQWSFNMALNQITSNPVYRDTVNLNVNASRCDSYPTYWVNLPVRQITFY